MRRLIAGLALALLASLLLGSPAQAAAPTCSRPASDAAYLYVLGALSPRQAPAYWWTKTNLTIGIQAEPGLDPQQYAAVERAIATWRSTVAECLGGAVTLTYVPLRPGVRATTDIVVHFTARAGGNAFGGLAECGQSCNNVLVSYIGPYGRFGDGAVAPTWYTEHLALHEIGHALGLGHAYDDQGDIYGTTDLMGYGVDRATSGTISQCDVAALAYVWSWALDGTAPRKPADQIFECR